jgi:radical SAM protein with 4Fe4S-binding SPASM domain
MDLVVQVVVVAVEAVVVAVVVVAVEEINTMKDELLTNFTFQWHITNICNNRCKHCYQDDFNSEGLPFEELAKILIQLQEFVKVNGIKKAHINITGGEPFLRDDIFDLILKIKETGVFSFSILTNGYIPSCEKLNKLKTLKPKFVQISLEGKRKTNDLIRGDGSYDKILQSLKVYHKLGIPTMISFTANAYNYMDYHHVVKIARKYNAFKIWTDRYLPNGKSDNFQMTTAQFKTLGSLINKEKRWNNYCVFSKTEISVNRALQFLICGGQPYRCSAGNTLLAILSNGDLLPCRRLPIKIGNLLSESIVELYKNSDIIKEIGYNDNLDINCVNCYYKTSCNGGLKCLSYIITEDFKNRDINCWL